MPKFREGGPIWQAIAADAAETKLDALARRRYMDLTPEDVPPLNQVVDEFMAANPEALEMLEKAGVTDEIVDNVRAAEGGESLADRLSPEAREELVKVGTEMIKESDLTEDDIVRRILTSARKCHMVGIAGLTDEEIQVGMRGVLVSALMAAGHSVEEVAGMVVKGAIGERAESLANDPNEREDALRRIAGWYERQWKAGGHRYEELCGGDDDGLVSDTE